MTMSRQKWPANHARIVSFIVLTILALHLMACSESENTLITWKDPTTGTRYEVRTRPGPIVKTNSTLYVESKTENQSKVIDDDAIWGTIAFVRYKTWVLVLNDKFVLAGHDTANGTLIGEGEWEKLPFTVRKTGGTVEASKVISSSSALPAMFPQIEEK